MTLVEEIELKSSRQHGPSFSPGRKMQSVVRPGRAFLDEDEERDERPLLKRYWIPIAVLVVAGVAIGITLKTIANSAATARKAPTVISLSMPPPPPPPPVQTAPPEVVQDQQTFQPEEKPEDEPPKPPDQPPIGTNIKGDGSSNGFNLSNSAGSGAGDGRTNASRFGWYAGQVQSKVSEALRANRKTRTAELAIRARIWPDENGHVTRAQLSGSTGDASLDAAIRDEVLSGLQLREPPPPGMPLPIVLRLSAKRPR
ncbi:MAG TPA: TonB C-terminal domain-containing protein [Chthoniobacterales bacterium]|jgi:outer membrane biosynthesis protein TonB